MQLSIVIPCYNEAETIDRLVSVLDKTVADLATRGHPTEVIVVDDGSHDASFTKLEQAARERAWLRVIRFRRNYGQTAALAAGFRAATGQVLIPMDADLQDPPGIIRDLVEKWREVSFIGRAVFGTHALQGRFGLISDAPGEDIDAFHKAGSLKRIAVS